MLQIRLEGMDEEDPMSEPIGSVCLQKNNLFVEINF